MVAAGEGRRGLEDSQGDPRPSDSPGGAASWAQVLHRLENTVPGSFVVDLLHKTLMWSVL